MSAKIIINPQSSIPGLEDGLIVYSGNIDDSQAGTYGDGDGKTYSLQTTINQLAYISIYARSESPAKFFSLAPLVQMGTTGLLIYVQVPSGCIADYYISGTTEKQSVNDSVNDFNLVTSGALNWERGHKHDGVDSNSITESDIAGLSQIVASFDPANVGSYHENLNNTVGIINLTKVGTGLFRLNASDDIFFTTPTFNKVHCYFGLEGGGIITSAITCLFQVTDENTMELNFQDESGTNVDPSFRVFFTVKIYNN